MRLLAFIVATLILGPLVPQATASEGIDCTIDLGEPTSPRIYGNCLGPELMDDPGDGAEEERQSNIDVAILDEDACVIHLCGVTISHEMTVGLNADRGPQTHFEFKLHWGLRDDGQEKTCWTFAGMTPPAEMQCIELL